MADYVGFAEVYDRFMDNVPYDEWAEYLINLLKKYGIHDGLICELGCGTGNMTERLFKAGYDMIGIDLSEEMLSIAHEKDPDNRILYLCQDMRNFELYGTVNAIVSVCDSMNYLLDIKDLIKVFKLANNYLEAGGYFIFDINPVGYYNSLGNEVIAENRENMSFIWENHFDEESHINEYDLTIYASDNIFNNEDNVENVDPDSGEHEALFHRFDETHFQRGYTVDEIKLAIEQSGMEFVSCYEAFTDKEPSENKRTYFIAREKYQEGKKYI